MARSRPLATLAELRREAADIADDFPTPGVGRLRLSRLFPGHPPNVYQEVYAEALQDKNAVELIMRANRGQFQRLDRLLGCDEDVGRVQLTVSVTSVDQGGERRWFRAAIDVDVRDPTTGRARTVGQQLDQAIAGVIAYAAEKGYDLQVPGSGQRAGPVSYRINQARCY